jgi:NitT/TauT family transport system ATP-binding protein
VIGDGTGTGGRTRLRASEVRISYWRDRADEPFVAVDGVSLEVLEGEFVSIVGPSGCGKTTFLNAVDGLIPISGGSLELDGRPVQGPGRDRAMVFQQPSLLPWRSVLRNITYGLELEGRRSRAEIRETGLRYLNLVGLDGFGDAYPGQLSGGMQQRVNLARALATDPEMLLLDEPFASLDAQTREFMQLELLRIWRQSRKTALFITHDIKEAIYLADRVVVFTARPGRVKEVVPVPLPRPRELRLKRDPRFIEIEDRVWNCIEQEAAAAMTGGRPA